MEIPKSPTLNKSLKTVARSQADPKPHKSVFGHESKDEQRNGAQVRCKYGALVRPFKSVTVP